MGLNSRAGTGEPQRSRAHRACGSERSEEGDRVAVPPGVPVPSPQLCTQKAPQSLGWALLLALAVPRFPFQKGTFSSPSKIITLKSLKNPNKLLVPSCQWMLIIPGILLSSGLSSSIIPPEIAWLVLIMFVPFLSALVISQVPSGWGEGSRHPSRFSKAPLFSLLRY